MAAATVATIVEGLLKIKALLLDPTTAIAALVALFTVLTSPRGVLELLWILGVAWPFQFLKSIAKKLVPQLFEKNVSNDVVVITGAAQGIGKLLAERFAKCDSTVVLLDVNSELLFDAKTEVAAVAMDKRKISAYLLDVTDKNEVYSTFARIKREVGEVTILVNNAGIVVGQNLLQTPDELMVRTMEVNTFAHFWTVKAVLPDMLEKNSGHIVSVASSAGLAGVPGLGDYCASKFAAVGFDESLRLELRKLGKTGVKTTCVCPFFINTGMFLGATTKWPRLLPMLEPERVADEILRATRLDEPFLITPPIANITWLARGILPYACVDMLADWFGLSMLMDRFEGRQSSKATSRQTSATKTERP